MTTKTTKRGRTSIAKNQVAQDRLRFLKARAQKESALADLAELAYIERAGKYVPREEVQQAAQIVIGAIEQQLRGIPLAVANRLAVRPEVAAEIELIIEAGLDDLRKAILKWP
jgi:hypothetical protein